MRKRICCTMLLSACLVAASFGFTYISVRAEAADLPEQEGTVTESTEMLSEETISRETDPVETEEPPVTVPGETEPVLYTAEPPPLVTVIPISQISELPPGTEGISFRGTVVLVRERNVVVQDDSGGICLTLAEDHGMNPGDILLVTGNAEETFRITAAVREGTGELPVVEMLLSQAPENLRIAVKECTLKDGVLTQGDSTVPLSDPGAAEGLADVYGVILDGIFYADTIVPIAQPEQSEWEWNVYFGLLHAHTEISDGSGTVVEAFSHAAGVEGLDFFAVTDHSNSFDHADSGDITVDGSAVSADWAAGKQAAASVTNSNFVGIFGYEMTWGEDAALGHINTFHTPGWQTREQPGFETLEGYYGALQKVPGSVSQFNHPGTAYGEFHNFREYDPEYDAVMQLLEVEGENGASYYDYYIRALDQGWHVAPTAGQNNHHGEWGSAGQARTAVLAKGLSEENLYRAMQRRRVYATQDADLRIEYRLNGQIMGSVIGLADTLEVSVLLEDPTDDAMGTVEAVTTGGRILASHQMEDASGEMTFDLPTGYPYYFLRITQPDGDVAVTAPVWVDSFTDMGIHSFSAETDTPEAGQAVDLTLKLYNYEEVPFCAESVALLCNGQKAGDFSPAEDGAYVISFLWQEPGEVRLTAVVQGTVDGKSRSFQADLTLHYQGASVTESTVSQTRSGALGGVFQVEGFATSGNTNPYTTFPNTIYLQDDTGGIPVQGEFTQKIQVGTALKVAGVLRERNGERYLDLTRYELTGKAPYRYVPRVMGCKASTDYESRGGSLVQVEGTAVSMTKTADGRGISRLMLRDIRGDAAYVVIEPEIRSGAYGTNRLASRIELGKTVRAIGLLYREESGKAVIRVRNCDEVVYVPPLPDPTNPKTGEFGILRILSDGIRARSFPLFRGKLAK